MAKKIMQTARSEAFGIFQDAETDWTFRRILERMIEQGAEIGECLYAARQIDEKVDESWMLVWEKLAENVEKQALRSLEGGHNVSAREAFIRASTYYSAAEYGTDPLHEKFDDLWKKSVSCFHKACDLFDPPIQKIEVEYQGMKLPGYFWRPDISDTKRPTLVAIGGNDSSLEEVFLVCGPAAIRRGYNFFTVEHPGHRGAVHLDRNCIKIHDYEKPFGAAFDLLQSLPGVDDRIAVTGFSFGGYVSSRVASHDDRVKALIPNSPIYDSYKVTMAFWSGFITKLPMSWLAKLSEMKLKQKPVLRALKHYNDWAGGLYPTSLSPEEKAEAGFSLLKKMQVNLADIHCPTLALVSDGDGPVLIEQANEFFRGISSDKKDIFHFTLKDHGSDDHCQLDNRSVGNQVMFDWLDEIFR